MECKHCHMVYVLAGVPSVFRLMDALAGSGTKACRIVAGVSGPLRYSLCLLNCFDTVH